MLQIEMNGTLNLSQKQKGRMRARGGIRMRPAGGMRLELGHEQAGLRDVLVPVRARLEDPCEMLTHVVDAGSVVDKAVLEVVLTARVVLLPLE